MKRKVLTLVGLLVLVMVVGCNNKEVEITESTEPTSQAADSLNDESKESGSLNTTEVNETEPPKIEANDTAKIDMLSADAYTPVIDDEGNTLECGNLASDGTIHLDKIYEETNAVVISMVWDENGYDNDCTPQFDMKYDTSKLALTGYGCGTGYYDKTGNLILINFYEKHENKVFDTVLVLAKDGVSVTLEPSYPSNDSPLQEATIQIADAKGVRTLSKEDIYTRGDTGIWYDAICTVKNGLAETY